MSRTSAARRFARLAVHALEARDVPANTLTVVAAGIDDSAFVEVSNQGQSIVIETLQPNAIVSLTTIQNALSQAQGDQVIVTTAVSANGVDGNQPGDIRWDSTTAGDLNFAGFDSGKTLIFRTVPGIGAVGSIDLTAVGFLNTLGNEQINLTFDTTLTNGAIGFHSGGPILNSRTVSFDSSILNLTIAAGTGGFTYDDADNLAAAAAAGDVSITAGPVSIFVTGGISAAGDITVAGSSVNLSLNTGLFADGNLSVAGTLAVNASSAPLTALNGSAAVTGGAIALFFGSDLSALTTVTVNGTSSVALFGMSMLGSGDMSITSGGVVSMFAMNATAGGKITTTGSDVQLTSSTLVATGDLTVTGSTSVSANGFSFLTGNEVTITSAGTLTLGDSSVNAGADASLTGRDVTLGNGSVGAGGDLSVTATDADPQIQLTDTAMSGGGNVTLTGAVQLAGLTVSVNGNARDSVVSFTSTVDGASDLSVSGGTVTFGGDLGGITPLGDVIFARGHVDLGTNTVTAATLSVGDGVADPLGEATLGGMGLIALLGTPFGQTADLVVEQDGNLAPGGVGTVGTLTVLANVIFNGGDFAVDLGATSDQLLVLDNPATDDGNPLTTEDVEGNVVLGAGSRLGGGLGTGTLPAGSPDVELIDFSGNLTGTFANAPLGVPVIAGTDAVRVTHYGPAGTGVTIGLFPAVAGGVFNTADPDDGTLITAKLTGGGELVGGTDADGRLFLVVRNATATSKLAITTKANGSDTLATIGGGIVVNGPLAGFTASRVSIGDQFRVTGPVKSATFRDLFSNDPAGANAVLEFGGPATSTTTITARNILGSVHVGGVLTKLTASLGLGARVNVSGLEDSTVTAASIGTITAKTINSFISTPGKVTTITGSADFFGGVTAASLGKLTAGSTTGSSLAVNLTGAATSIIGTGNVLNLDLTADSVGSVTVSKGTLGPAANGWNVTSGIGTLTAGAIGGITLKARNLGTVKVMGTPDLSGTIAGSIFTLTGNDGTVAQYGIKSLTAAGTVSDSTFDVKAGNVGPVKVGRFITSRLYLNYTPPSGLGVGFNNGGAFGATGFKLTSFTTTAVATANSSNPLNFAYQDSEIAADTIGSVTLSGLKTANGGTAFGVKVRQEGTKVVVKAGDAGFPANLLNKPISTTDTPIGDFYFLMV